MLDNEKEHKHLLKFKHSNHMIACFRSRNVDLGASVILAEIDAMGAGASARSDSDPEVGQSILLKWL